jgi:hypothetical protein
MSKSTTNQELTKINEQIRLLETQISPIVNEIKQLSTKRQELMEQSSVEKYQELLPLSIEKVASSTYKVLQANQAIYNEVRNFINSQEGLSYQGGHNPTTEQISIKVNCRKKLSDLAISNIKKVLENTVNQEIESNIKLKILFQDKYKQVKFMSISEKTCGEYGIFYLAQTDNTDLFLIKIVYGSYKLIAKLTNDNLKEELRKYCE